MDRFPDRICREVYNFHNHNINIVLEVINTFQKMGIEFEEWCLLGCYAVWLL
jgi:hypothetical protein